MATTKKAPKASAQPSLKVGDQVRWDSSGGSAEGRIIKIATKSGSIKGFDYKATKDDPRFIVETAEGKQAAHKAEELRKT
jgi:hypothetical protein